MRKTLYWKFLLGYLIFAFFGFLIVTFFVSGLTRDHLKKEKAEALYKEAILLSNSYAADLYSGTTSLEAVKKQLDALAVCQDCSIMVMNPSGLVLVDSDHDLNVETQMVIAGFDPTITGNGYYAVGDFFGTFSEDVMSVYAPITSEFAIKGYVVILTTLAEIRASADSLLNISYLLLLILFLLSLIILIFFTMIVYQPIRRITRATAEYATGNYKHVLSVESDDEIGYLAASLAYMADRLSQEEDNQKKLVANISHDFRSPLTSIKGYLEAMLDGTIPPQMQDKYLGIVLNETDRLTKLTNNLLTLNNLNIKGMVLEKTDFDINRVIRNTAATCEGSCRAKMIAIELVLTGEEMWVHADMGRIQQVLYNLLDNAIKFSHSDSVIKVETTLRGNKLFVSVKDHGIGIPKDSMKNIWDRFYKTDVSRGKDKKGTGLGLSIVREIIRAHEENITVVSTEGVGTDFTFSLPYVEQDED